VKPETTRRTNTLITVELNTNMHAEQLRPVACRYFTVAAVADLQDGPKSSHYKSINESY